MKKFAFLFPGQGSQSPGMGKDFYDAFASAREVFEEADDLLSMHLSRIMFEGPADRLTETRYSQLAIFVNSAAILQTLRSQLPQLVPIVCAGLSLGEYTALYASGRIDLASALHLVRIRADLMNLCCEKTSGSMAAILGMKPEGVEEAIKNLPGVWVANYNCPGQIVISGTLDGVAVASQALKEAGAKRVIPLSVHGAFHSPLMKEAQEKLIPFLEQVALKESPISLVMNVTGGFVEGLDEVRSFLMDQVVSSVRWEAGMIAMASKGVEGFLEIGSGKALSGFNKKILPSVLSLSLEKVSDLEAIVQQVEGAICSY